MVDVRTLPSVQHAHHDGSSLYVSDPHPDLGDTVTVFLRAPHTAGVEHVHLYAVRDGEPEYVEAVVDRQSAAETWWRAELTAHNPVTRYRFLVDGGTARHRWVTGRGVAANDPTDDGDFRLTTHEPPPAWAGDAIFYQVFPDRFATSGTVEVTPTWAEPAAWDDPVETGGDAAMHQLYGGDFEGLRRHLDHLEELGVTALYSTPFFPAESNHRYNASSFTHVDPVLGGDEALARLTAALHDRGMRMIGDLTPNHCGSAHPWFRAAQADAGSVEAGFFTFTSHPDQYISWLGVDTLPKFDHSDAELRWRLYEGPRSVVAHWLRPPFSLDGWRMDVAHMTGRWGRRDMNREVSRGMRRTVETVNPEALLIAEHPFDASEVLLGDAYHGTMNYAGFARPVWSWLGVDRDVEFLGLPVPIPPLGGATVAATMSEVRAAAPWTAAVHAFNQLGSHDTARFRSVVGGAGAGARQLAAAALLFTLPGMPVVFAGDEIGQEGATTLAARQPFPWDRGRWDTGTFSGYQRFIALRRSHAALRRGGFRWVHVGDNILAYLRETHDERLLVAVSRSGHPAVEVSATALAADRAESLLDAPDLTATPEGVLRLPAREGPASGVWRLGNAHAGGRAR